MDFRTDQRTVSGQIWTNESAPLCGQVVTNTYEAYQVFSNPGELMSWPPWAEVLCRFNHLMLAINSSINIIIYMAKVIV